MLEPDRLILYWYSSEVLLDLNDTIIFKTILIPNLVNHQIINEFKIDKIFGLLFFAGKNSNYFTRF